MNGEIFDSGSAQVFVPEGWRAFLGTDSDGNLNPRKIFVYKGAQHELDIFTHAGITLCFYGKGMICLSGRDFYSDVCNIDPFTLGEYDWEGYTCTSLGYPYTMLEAEKDGHTVQVMILEKNGEWQISPEDDDVRAVIASISFRE